MHIVTALKNMFSNEHIYHIFKRSYEMAELPCYFGTSIPSIIINNHNVVSNKYK